MSDQPITTPTPEALTDFKTNRINSLKALYSDEMTSARGRDSVPTYRVGSYVNAAAVRTALTQTGNRNTLVESSQQLYATNPIYAAVLNYLSNMFMWRYKVIPHKRYTKSKTKINKTLTREEYQQMYSLMLEVCDGLSLDTQCPNLLTTLFMNGAVYFTTYHDATSIAIDTIILPDKYCRKIGETQFGTSIIEFDFSYFSNLGLKDKDLKLYLKQFPEDFTKLYKRYLKDKTNAQWQILDPRFSSGILLNDLGMPTYFYLYGGILDYEKYQDNELERNENQLKYVVVHEMPHYEDKLIFEVDEVKAIHQSLSRVISNGDKARLITTWGQVHVEKIAENDTAENKVLSNAFDSIFNNAGFNSTLFTGESVAAVNMSLIRDKGNIFRYVQKLVKFYTITINNWYNFKDYEADLDILPISIYTYNDDIKVFKDNATLGVGKLDYLIAAGIKQRNIQDTFELESFLQLENITPMQTSYTQTAEDRQGEATGAKTEEETASNDDDSEIEPSEKIDKDAE